MGGDDSSDRHLRRLKKDRALALLVPHVCFACAFLAGLSGHVGIAGVLFIGGWGGVLTLSCLAWRELSRYHER